jgi:hypothetical protein
VAEDLPGVLVRLDRPVAAFVNPLALRWLCGQDHTTTAAVARDRAACVRAWVGAGLVEATGVDSLPEAAVVTDAGVPRHHDAVSTLTADLLSWAGQLPRLWDTSVLVIAVADSCGFCSQLEADLSANARVFDRAAFGLLVIGDGQIRRYGFLPSGSLPALASLGDLASGLGTPSGIFQQPGRAPRVVIGYDQVVAALVEAAGWDQNVVVETPTSCSVSVTQARDLLIHPLSAGGQVVGVGLGGSVTRDLSDYVLRRSAGEGFVPIVLTVDRPRNLFLVFRGGELLGRLRTVTEVGSLLDTVLAGYAVLAEHQCCARVPMMCGALYRAEGNNNNNEVVLFPRRWMSDLVKQQSRIRRTGWAVCPDPYVILTVSGKLGALQATVHPFPVTSPGPWPARTAPVHEFLVDEPSESARRVFTPGQLMAQVVNWVARPATADQIQAVASVMGEVPMRAASCSQLINDITASARR